VSENPLDLVARALAPEQQEALHGWLGPAGYLDPRALHRHHEAVESSPEPPQADDPGAVRSVGVIGGGTAGYLTALALRAKRPWLEVTVVESKDIPIIGVGEATVPTLLSFLHHDLGVDVADFYARVKPTWKLGISFKWGPAPDGFMAPFDWGAHSIGALGALRENGTVNGFTVESLMMMADLTPVLNVDGRAVSLLKYLPFAYHLDNVRFVRYLAELAGRRGVRHVDATVDQVVLGADGWVDSLTTAGGQDLRYDFYVDCSGFRSVLIGEVLRTPFESYASSLFTDSAVTGNVENGGHLRPYTTAATMDSGWCWRIPVSDGDHLGYVYSSAAMSDDAAADELSRRFPGVTEPRQVRFRSGRRQAAWRGNVMAIGNSYAFVEPLESTAIQMMTTSIEALVSALPTTWSIPAPRAVVNEFLNGQWDALRWFLAVHYRFNTRLDTPFWKEVRATADVSGWHPLLDVFASGAPMIRRDYVMRWLARNTVSRVYCLSGVDNILLGQQVPTRLLRPAEPPGAWQQRRRAAEALVALALPQRDALRIVAEHSELLRELFSDADSWVRPPEASG
jgi:tryptophan halogenase